MCFFKICYNVLFHIIYSIEEINKFEKSVVMITVNNLIEKLALAFEDLFFSFFISISTNRSFND